MIPLTLAPRHLRLGLAGAGAPALRRLRALARGGAETLSIYTRDEALAAEACAGTRPLPSEEEIAQLHILWIAGLEREEFIPLAEAARRNRVLVNVEDEPDYCDFHNVSELRRGDLLLTASTGGTAPGLAARIRARLEELFPAVWEERVKEISALRQSWRAERMPMAEAARRIAAIAEERCWLPPTQPR